MSQHYYMFVEAFYNGKWYSAAPTSNDSEPGRPEAVPVYTDRWWPPEDKPKRLEEGTLFYFLPDLLLDLPRSKFFGMVGVDITKADMRAEGMSDELINELSSPDREDMSVITLEIDSMQEMQDWVASLKAWEDEHPSSSGKIFSEYSDIAQIIINEMRDWVNTFTNENNYPAIGDEDIRVITVIR